jgi:Na+-driven multidrug efflux pump
MIQMLLIVVEIFLLNRAGTTALAAVATVFPLVMLAHMLSAGAIGGATSGAVARSLGSSDLVKANSILRSAVFIALVGGAVMGALVTIFGPTFFYWVGARDDVLAAANAYARVVFFGIPLVWLFNMMCSVLRGAGAMTRSALAMGSVVLVYSVLGFWLIPEQDAGKSTSEIMTTAAYILLASYGMGIVTVFNLILLPGQPVRFRGFSVDWSVVAALLRSGLLAGTQSTATIVYSLIATGLLGRFSIDWLAGYGLAVRLELVMVPVIFGIGSALIAIVGAYAGAGQRARAIEVAWRGYHCQYHDRGDDRPCSRIKSELVVRPCRWRASCRTMWHHSSNLRPFLWVFCSGARPLFCQSGAEYSVVACRWFFVTDVNCCQRFMVAEFQLVFDA